MAPLVVDVITEAEIYILDCLTQNAKIQSVVGNRIYKHPAPRTDDNGALVTYPILTYNFMYSVMDTLLVGSQRFWSTLRFMVRMITDTNDPLIITEGVTGIYEALHGTAGYTAKATISACIHDKPFDMTEISVSTQYIHRGGEFLININGNYGS